MSRNLARELDVSGFAMAHGVLGATLIQRLDEICTGLVTASSQSSSRVPGVRIRLDDHPDLLNLLNTPALVELAAEVLEGTPRPIKAILFQKTNTANWKVPWHQDVTISVREKRDVPGFNGWSVKSGFVHVQAPPDILEKIVALRLHLDVSNETSGTLTVLPGSHRAGRLAPDEIQSSVLRIQLVTCVAESGDVLLMRPLLLHKSRPAARPSGRKVLHVEYSATDLPGGLEWL